jgi:predicted O-linked N-acetylglucosamine transferase (SPINDLY family)
MEEILIQSKIDTRSILHGMTQMPVQELETFLQEVSALIRRKKTEDKEGREGLLLEKINQTILDKKKKERYQSLVIKLEADTISEIEHAEFTKLADLQEKLRNQRVKYLIELSQLRAVSLPQLMNSMGLNSIAHG